MFNSFFVPSATVVACDTAPERFDILEFSDVRSDVVSSVRLTSLLILSSRSRVPFPLSLEFCFVEIYKISLQIGAELFQLFHLDYNLVLDLEGPLTRIVLNY